MAITWAERGSSSITRHLAEEAAFPQHRENHLPAILGDEHYLHLTRRDQEQGVARVVLEDDHAALGIAALAGQLGERGEVGLAQTGEKWDLAEDLDRGQGHGGLAEAEVFGGSLLAAGGAVNEADGEWGARSAMQRG